MLTRIRQTLRRSLVPLAVLEVVTWGTLALAQPPKEEPKKEVTDGFFTVPDRDPSEIPDEIGLPAYLVTSALAGGAIFIICKSARRS